MCQGLLHACIHGRLGPLELHRPKYLRPIPRRSFFERELGHARATELYELGADVVFHASGLSGLGLFDAALAQSEATGQHFWAIGADNDQWFQVTEPQQKHILTSMIKRAMVR